MDLSLSIRRYYPVGQLVLILLVARAFWHVPVTAADPPASTDATSPDAELREKILGTWRDEYQGKRTMTVRADGTATMLVELQGWRATVYASKLTFEMIWSIDAGRFHKRTTGGDPPGKVKMVLKMMGDRTTERILELTSDRLLLLDQNGKRQYDWHRVKSSESPSSPK